MTPVLVCVRGREKSVAVLTDRIKLLNVAT